MYLVASQHYCLYTYMIIPDYRFAFDRLRKNFRDYRKVERGLEFHRSGGIIEKYATTHELIDSIFSLKK